MSNIPRIVILTGAGISAESGIETFRGSSGLWARQRIEDVATPKGYARDPGMVNDFYRARRGANTLARPNAAHLALAQLHNVLGDSLLVVTQNIDDLHERGGLPPSAVVHMHGQLSRSLCPLCCEPSTLDYGETCDTCFAGVLRPDVVWFGEQPYDMERIEEALDVADVFVAIGTSGNVYPAAGFRERAVTSGAYAIELNLEPTYSGFDVVAAGPATELVPGFVRDVLAGMTDEE